MQNKNLTTFIIVSLVVGTVVLSLFQLGFFNTTRPSFPPATNQQQASRTSLPTPQINLKVEETPDHGLVEIVVGTKILEVEVVNTSASITQGLSGREEIGAEGMLFVLSQSMVPRFWMKEMQFPLDIVWINNGVIVDITENAPPPEPMQALNELPTFAPKEPVNWVLEVPAGTVAKQGFKQGDTVTSYGIPHF